MTRYWLKREEPEAIKGKGAILVDVYKQTFWRKIAGLKTRVDGLKNRIWPALYRLFSCIF